MNLMVFILFWSEISKAFMASLEYFLANNDQNQHLQFYAAKWDLARYELVFIVSPYGMLVKQI